MRTSLSILGVLPILMLKLSLAHAVKNGAHETKMEAAGAYLQSIASTTEFSKKQADHWITEMSAICDEASLPNELRSRACLTQSGIAGRVSDQLRSNGGSAYGKRSIALMKKSVQLDPNNEDAVRAHAITIDRLRKNGGLKIFFIEKALGVSLKEETQNALSNLTQLGLGNDPVAQSLRAP